jgi:hypothetical protein
MATSIASGLGSYVLAAQQTTYGAVPSFGSARTLGTFKSWKPTVRPHPVQGGPYLRNGQSVDQGSARLLIWQDGMATVSGDVAMTGYALLLASALAPASATLTQLGTTTAYGLGGAAGISYGVPDLNSTFLDCQVAVPDAGSASVTPGTLHPETFHSGVIQTSTWVFDRTNYVTYEHDIDFQQYEVQTAITAASETGGPIPFDMVNNGAVGNTSTVKIGTFGSEVLVSGARKTTIKLERKMDLERIYNGYQYKLVPVTNGLSKITVTMEADYTSDMKTALFDLFIAGTPISVVATSVGPQIGSSIYYNTFQLNPTNCFVETGGEAPLDGPDLVKNSLSLVGTIDASNDAALKALLYTADSTF